MISRYAPDDPIFWLTHSWLDYIYTVWKNCWGYNQIESKDLDNYPKAYYSFPNNDHLKDGVPSSGLDDRLYYVSMKTIDIFCYANQNVYHIHVHK